MKLRTDFVTNSSSSSFVTVKIKSAELAELLRKYDVTITGIIRFQGEGDYDIFIKEENMFEGSVSSVEDLLEVFFNQMNEISWDGWCDEDLESAIDEYNDRKEYYINSVEKAYYSNDTNSYGEFGEDDDSSTFVYE